MCTPLPRSAARAGDGLESAFGERETGMGADEPAPAGTKETLVLGQPGPHAVGAVAVGDLVAARGPDADLGACVGDDAE